MPQAQNPLAPYEDRLLDLRERMIRTIGVHTVNVLMERAIWEAARQYPELSLIERTGEGLSFAALERAYADRPQQEIADAFSDLTSELLLILARLLGKEMAQRLAEELETRMRPEPETAAREGVAP
jgi:hypothetical protein